MGISPNRLNRRRSQHRSRHFLRPRPASPRPVTELPLAVVVDDSAADRLLAATLLKHAGYEVMVCADGRAGLDMVLKEHPDLIIADLITPNIDGYDLARAVRFDPQTSTTPIILQTAHYLEA